MALPHSSPWRSTHRITFSPTVGDLQEWVVMTYVHPISEAGRPFWVCATEEEWNQGKNPVFTLGHDGPHQRPMWKGLPTPHCQPGRLVIEHMTSGYTRSNRFKAVGSDRKTPRP